MKTLSFDLMEQIEGGTNWAKCATGVVGSAGIGALAGAQGGGAAGTVALPIVGTVSGAVVGGVLGGLFGGLVGAASFCFD